MVLDPAWLTDPNNANYVAPALRDPNAVKLLSRLARAEPGTTQLPVDTRPNEQDTRQEVGRVDWQVSAKWRLMARYTHDLSKTTEPGGLFFGTAIPNVATTLTDVPGQIFVGQIITTINPHMLNEVSLPVLEQRDQVGLRRERAEQARPVRHHHPRAVPGEPQQPDPVRRGHRPVEPSERTSSSTTTTRTTRSATTSRTSAGNHSWKGGFLIAFEQKNEVSTSRTQGSFSFAAGGRLHRLPELPDRQRRRCVRVPPAPTPSREGDRRPGALQPLRVLRPGLLEREAERLTLDLGVRYALYPGVTDVNNLLTNFVPSRFDPSKAPHLRRGRGTRWSRAPATC